MKTMVKNMIFLFFCFVSIPIVYGTVGDRTPIKDTQTDPVPVTPELLNRESESGPASPTFKMPDTSIFFSGKPYDYLDKDLSDSKIDSSIDVSEDWFSLGDETIESSTEAVEQKELK